MKRVLFSTLLVVVLLTATVAVTTADASIGINVVLNTEITDDILAELGTHGKVLDLLYEVKALTMKVKASQLPAIQALPYVAAANPDAERHCIPVDTVFVEDFANGLSTWNLDAINVTDPGFDNRQVEQDGTGVYVAVLDTGLLGTWRQYFPEERIAVEYAKCFGGGGGEKGFVSEQPNKWERDTNSHGTHVASTILGYSILDDPINGVAPMAKVIPVKVLNQNGAGWSSVGARGIVYVGNLKAPDGLLHDYPVVINMSLGGPEFGPMEAAAIDYAIDQGVIIVAAAGNEDTDGMVYPGAYEPVISVAASGWIQEWVHPWWWWWLDVPEDDPDQFYITEFSSRALGDQDLDVAAPGSWVVGPYQLQMGKISYYFLGGTSMASSHVAGLVALMAEKHPGLTAPDAESILETTALDLGWNPEAQGAGQVDAAAALADTP